MLVHPRRSHWSVRLSNGLLALTLLWFAAAGCASTAGKLHQSAKGAVYLEEIADWAFEASHPVLLDQTTMTKILRGIYANDVHLSSKMPATGGKPMRVFSDEDADFLAPLLAQGLSQAKPEQLVGFRVSPSAGSGSEPTAGTLYVQRGSVYVTLTQIRGQSTKHQRSDPKGMNALSFVPEGMARIEKASAYAAAGSSNSLSLVIDYHAIAKAPMPAAMPTAAARTESTATAMPVSMETMPAGSDSPATADDFLSLKLEELRQAKEANSKKDTQLSVLRKELEWMKRELRERTDEIKALRAQQVKTKPAAKKKPAQASRR